MEGGEDINVPPGPAKNKKRGAEKKRREDTNCKDAARAKGTGKNPFVKTVTAKGELAGARKGGFLFGQGGGKKSAKTGNWQLQVSKCKPGKEGKIEIEANKPAV